jgi:DNA primase
MDYNEFVHLIDIDALEEAINFEPIEQTEAEDRGYCPLPFDLHKNGDTTGKFSINRHKKVYGCWVCGGGSFLSLAMNMNNMDTKEATEWLHQFVGSESDDNLLERVQQIFDKESPEPFVLPYHNDAVLDKWLTPDHPWVKERGISPSIARAYKIGYDESLTRHRSLKKGGGSYTGPAIILPHYWHGQLVGWQTRWLSDDLPDWLQKYDNKPDFPKNETLFNYDHAKLCKQPPIVVESVPTSLFLLSHGYSTVATFGSKVTEEQMIYLRGFQQGILFAPDNDGAGQESLAKVSSYLSPYIPFKVVVPPEGEGADLGDLVNDQKQLRKLVENAYVI